MKMDFQLKSSWPKLAWVAVLSPVSNIGKVLHGPMVEVRENWAIEGIWDKFFEDGDFDRTDLIFGSGVRQRGEEVFFVSSATGVDRLWYVNYGNEFFVSNTLPGLLATAELSLLEDYPFYTKNMESVQSCGVYSHVKQIPTTGPNLNLVYYKNILWNGKFLEEVEKPNLTPEIRSFHSYENFLKKTAKKLGKNSRSKLRNYPVDMLVGLSTGYDSIATAVVAKYAGCKQAASIVNSSSLWRGSDSGKQIAEFLGIGCELYQHDPVKYREEISIWAGAGRPGGRNLTLFKYPKPLSVFFSGGFGDTVWDRNSKPVQDPKGGLSELLCEFRLIEGVFYCVIPWWGIRRANEIQKINHLDEMSPWFMGNRYDRPIARRLIEEAGVPRGTFAKWKMDTSSNSPLRWPSTKVACQSLKGYLDSLGLRVPSEIEVKSISVLSVFLNLSYKNTVKKFGIKKWWRPWLNFPAREQLFRWSNHSLRDTYYE